jgi:hypothetical protein
LNIKGVRVKKNLVGEKSHRKRALKAFKVPLEKFTMVLRGDVGLDKVEALSKRALVGRFEYIAPTRVEVIRWINEVWNPFLGYFPRYVTLMK